MPTFNYVRLYEDASGISHFEDVQVDLSDNGSASQLSPTLPVSGMNFRRNLMSYDLDWHAAPRRQFIVNLTGGVEITASDGEVRVFGPGSIMLVEDTTGKGHKSKATGTEERLSLFVHLPD
jgi:hypothetical protein